MESVEDRLARVEGICVGINMLVRDLAVLAVPDELRTIRRDVLCQAVERIYGDPSVKLMPHAHLSLQHAIATIEGAFSPEQPDQPKQGLRGAPQK